MVKNHLEKLFSKSIKADSKFWGMKLHNNPLAHQTTPADYILTNKPILEDGSVLYATDLPKVHLVECKQVTCKEGKGRLAFNRLKQLHDLMAFEQKFEGFHHSWFCIGFYDSGWLKSEVYIIPIKYAYNQMQLNSKVSFNRTDMKRIFIDYQVDINKGVIELWKLAR